jgi:hypothetical protein
MEGKSTGNEEKRRKAGKIGIICEYPVPTVNYRFNHTGLLGRRAHAGEQRFRWDTMFGLKIPILVLLPCQVFPHYDSFRRNRTEKRSRHRPVRYVYWAGTCSLKALEISI